MTTMTVIKNDHTGQEVWRYAGRLLARGTSWVKLEAFFNRPDRATPYHTFRQGDRFIEWFYSDRWYNIFEIHDRDGDALKGWYCNIGFPAEIGEESVSYIDLALDLLVYPDGRQLVLDEDEFAAMPLSPQIREKGKASLAELQGLFQDRLARIGAQPGQLLIV